MASYAVKKRTDGKKKHYYWKLVHGLLLKNQVIHLVCYVENVFVLFCL